jgi:RND superfamily putative drug exporter
MAGRTLHRRKEPLMSSLTRWVLAHRWIVVALWIVLAGISGANVARATAALTYDFSVPGHSGYETDAHIVRLYGNGGDTNPVVPVIHLPPGVTATQPAIRAQLARAFAAVARALPEARVVSFASTGNRAFVSADGRTTFGLVYAYGAPSGPPAGLAATQRALAHVTIAGERFQVTGTGALQTSPSSNGVGVLGETLLGSIGALLVLLFVFRSGLAVLPFLMAAVSVPTTFMLVWALTTVMDVSFIVEFLVAIIGLGVGIDYSLLVVTRWREERATGISNEAAVLRAMETAGRAVLFSGSTVAVGLLALVALPLPFLRSVGVGGMLIPLVSVVAALTLLPVLLATVGPRLDRIGFRTASTDGRFWSWWGRQIVARPAVAALLGAAILGVLVAGAATIHIGAGVANPDASSGAARTGLIALDRSGIGPGVLTPFEMLAPGNANVVRGTIDHVSGVGGSVAPPDWRRGGFDVIDAFTVADGDSVAGRATLARVRAAMGSLEGQPGVGGSVAEDSDFISATYGSFPLVIAIIVVLTFLLLVRAVRSIVLPLKAIVLNLVSVAAAWGVMVFIWQDGLGATHIWGLPATGAITSWIPFTVFSFLFGLSMDYEVFLLVRIREEYDRTGRTDAAIVGGVGRTGRLITSAALILFLSFVSMASAPVTDVKVLATGLGAGILLDATVVRMLLAPALVRLFGEWNWWMPAPVATLFRLEGSERDDLRDAA